MLFTAHIRSEAGYYCRGCRLKLFAKYQGLTLVLGWWGWFSFVFYNPFAILVNLWALIAAPLNAASRGAISIDDLLAAAAEQRELEDLYARMPTWVEQLTDEELGLITSGHDFYATLQLAPDADEATIKAAYREMARRYHPDVAADPRAHEQMVALNEAYEVLGNARLRYAYDHVHELIDALDLDGDRDGGDHDGQGRRGRRWSCKGCPAVFEDYDEALAHVDREHADLTYVDPRAALAEI